MVLGGYKLSTQLSFRSRGDYVYYERSPNVAVLASSFSHFAQSQGLRMSATCFCTH